MWWLRRSINVTSASQCRSALAVAIPAKPPPTTMMRGLAGRSDEEVACGGKTIVESLIFRPPSAGSDRFRGRCRASLYFRPQLNELEQHFVSLGRQFVNGARTDLGAHALDKLFLHVGRQYRLPENLPPRCHRAGELLEEMFDAALPAAEMVQKQAPHDAPPQARAPRQGGIGIG